MALWVVLPRVEKRDIEVGHTNVFRRTQRFTPRLIDGACPSGTAPGNRWFVDETYVKVAVSFPPDRGGLLYAARLAAAVS
jgi:transposase-like protein